MLRARLSIARRRWLGLGWLGSSAEARHDERRTDASDCGRQQPVASEGHRCTVALLRTGAVAESASSAPASSSGRPLRWRSASG